MIRIEHFEIQNFHAVDKKEIEESIALKKQMNIPLTIQEHMYLYAKDSHLLFSDMIYVDEIVNN